jgi:hypothetical protein
VFLSTIVQVLDFLIKASAEYVETSEGRKEWMDVVNAVRGEQLASQSSREVTYQ